MSTEEGGFTLRILLQSLIITLFCIPIIVVSAEQEQSKEDLLTERMNTYVKYASLDVPWFYLAAIDQYERNIQQVRSDIPSKEGLIAIQFQKEFWVGDLNPNSDDQSPFSIAFFGGEGIDGNKDGIVNPDNPDDAMATMAAYLESNAFSEKGLQKALLNYYKRKETVNQITTIAKIYEQFQTISLEERAFPLPVNQNYSYRGTWGMSRGWGGRRIHEGTDLFASYGVPIRSTSYGMIEVMGWNDYGGWRVGIRDMHNTYHYYAHLSGFNKEYAEGDIVEPGTIIGYVGSSGYGKEGTSGKFPPHLHYGMYKYNGRTEWAFDPFPYLRLWEQQEKSELNK